MNAETKIDNAISEKFVVVRNHEEQYSIWPAERDIPLGWNTVGEPSSKDECLTFIEKIWIDMRPLSVKEWMKSHDSSPKVEA